jgi:predicted nucleic acid-binding Zn ribbon protein
MLSTLYLCDTLPVLGFYMVINVKESKTAAALRLVAKGFSVADAARKVGISTQAVYEATKPKASKRHLLPGRKCCMCGAALPDSARATAKTCSNRCRQQLSAQRKRVAAERIALGLPPEA